MYRRIAVIQGHPDGEREHLCHSLARAYIQGAKDEDSDVRSIEVAKLDFACLRSQEAWESEPVPRGLYEAQEVLGWAEHWVLLFPPWLGDMPALTKAFLEQVLRPGFAFERATRGSPAQKLLGGKSARLVITMGMPATLYRWYFRAHSVKSLERNILGYCGIAPIDETLVGMVEGLNDVKRAHWLAKMRMLGREGR